ncbi:uncharacterized protein PRCAT00000263001 [Priceomyces carsonii]|uniref:uncharacterized protein n=1 Tax=Priceomyces carsonii TaxID=28549 RepID=UPI002ED91BA0|nr:unnamed protein product [Priceomyces carsonii]
MSDYFLGFDLSTQQLKIIVADEKLNHLDTFHVEFDEVFKNKYGVEKGVYINGEEVLSPVAMWLDSIDYVLGQMKEKGFDFSKVRGISGSGQQHGSVYWSESAPKLLSNLNSSQDLASQLNDALAIPTSPNWQDHSTGKEIKDFEKVAGGADKLAELTGSRAHYRFTGLQIRKIATRKDPENYKKTFRISLVSSFVASILLGKIANIEQAEACGMNLYDISEGKFDEHLLAVAAGTHLSLDNVSEAESLKGVTQLKKKLGDIKPISYQSLGNISSYFVEKYGFNKDTRIYSFTGDNLATIISLPLQPNDCLISLGTSTTVLIVTKNFKPSSQYHLFDHPTMPGHYMGMICYCNGALARENVRNELNKKLNLPKNSWDKFDEILDKSSEFNESLGIYFPLGEIVPNASAQIKRSRVDENGNVVDVKKWDVENDVTSIVESQSLSCRLRTGPMLSENNSLTSGHSKSEAKHFQDIYSRLHERFGDLYTDGKKQTLESLIARPNKCFYVGGASKNTSIIKKMGSILGALNGNFKVEIPNACALGGAYKASWSRKCENEGRWIKYEDYIENLFNYKDFDSFKVKDNWENYFDGVGLLAEMESKLIHD